MFATSTTSSELAACRLPEDIMTDISACYQHLLSQLARHPQSVACRFLLKLDRAGHESDVVDFLSRHLNPADLRPYEVAQPVQDAWSDFDQDIYGTTAAASTMSNVFAHERELMLKAAREVAAEQRKNNHKSAASAKRQMPEKKQSSSTTNDAFMQQMNDTTSEGLSRFLQDYCQAHDADDADAVHALTVSILTDLECRIRDVWDQHITQREAALV